MKKMEEAYNPGLYTPQLEKDSCGVGLLAQLDNESSFYILDSALTMLENMEHRGACGCEENTGDGAGILTQIPDQLFRKYFKEKDLRLPPKGKYGVGMFFFPKDAQAQKDCFNIINHFSNEQDFELIHTRIVPTDNRDLGETALRTEPKIIQLFFKTTGFNYKDLERRFYFLRSLILKHVYDKFPEFIDDFYIASLSSKTIVYKGMLKATQLRSYFPDLQSSLYQSAVAIVHSRFSTNTFPKWKLAQPFRCIAHNGEINTIQGNLNWWAAREKNMELVAKDMPILTKVFPVCDPYISDSGNFDNVVDFLLRASRSIPHSIMMMIPEAWQNDDTMDDYKKAFYQYHDAVMEPWDGPASICFTDGTIVGATLDRNGLRPSRYMVTSDNLLILGSEAGCIDIDPEKIVHKGRLMPGKMLVADLDEKRIISDEELKQTICRRKPYEKWIEENTLLLEELDNKSAINFSKIDLATRQKTVGFTKEDSKLILDSMLQHGSEAIGSMGVDIPLAVLSKHEQHIANYFKQQFAQVTNPPIDSLREKFYMSLGTSIGGGSKIIGTDDTQAKVIRCNSPILTNQALSNLLKTEKKDFESYRLRSTYRKGNSLQLTLEKLCDEALEQIEKGKKIICISDRNMDANNIPIPSLMITGALHHFMINNGLRKDISIVIDAGDIWETHHAAILLSYGADLICPHLALESVSELAQKKNIDPILAEKKYIKALEKGILKIMSKLGISTLASYKGAQTFEALGLAQNVVNRCFKGTITRIGGLNFEDLQREAEIKHDNAFSKNSENLQDQGIYRWKRKGEYHLFNPTTIHFLQHSAKTNDYEVYKKFAQEIDNLETNSSTLRSYLKIKKGVAIPIDEVESTESIWKRFATGAMSFGSISEEAHTTLAIAMNRIGGKSNSGEGGEDSARFQVLKNGDSKRSAIKQVASGRFGVNIHYLTNAEELQIKIAQGAKPGEGGQLPGHKVDYNIAKVRNSTPGVGLISPPPHHDIYSIEDLAQLIFDLKNANRTARISVKLVSKAGVGVIATGVTKAHADHILISGFDGGTGASPLSSIKHAGLPWELGLSETHQTLTKNGLRDRVVLQTDGQIRTGRDLAIATMLGAEEWGIATAALVVEGCILMRKCHLNTCPVGIATQDTDLRQKFAGKVEHLINYFSFMANHLREIMASLGVRTVNELVGRTDLLEIADTKSHWKTKNLKLETLLKQEFHPANETNYCSKKQDHGIADVLDHTIWAKAKNAIEYNTNFSSVIDIQSTDRAVGTILSNEITKKYGGEGMKNGSINYRFRGSAGQSFGAFGAKGLSFILEGEANDYLGKGLSGAEIGLCPDRKNTYTPSENIIAGNVALYGATVGELYINGIAGDRFCVRNSGAKTVVEGIGDNGCEYMTGGLAIILGKIGRNFAAGMSGGIAFLYNHERKNDHLINTDSVDVDPLNQEDEDILREYIRKHVNKTGSTMGLEILKKWEIEKLKFLKVFPIEYKRVLEKEQDFKLRTLKAI